MLVIDNADYSARLRFKKGEEDALFALDDPCKASLLPQLILPPLKHKDIEKGRRLSREEYVRTHVGRILRCWGKRTCIVDAGFVKFDEDLTKDAVELENLLQHFDEFSCSAISLVDLSTSKERLEVFRRSRTALESGLALRISLRDLDRDNLASALHTSLMSLGALPHQTILVVDLADADLTEPAAFASFCHEWIERLEGMGGWRRIIIQASNFPQRNPAPKNGETNVDRIEWKAWKQLLRLMTDAQGTVMFGDFGADHGIMDFSGGGIPIRHHRYATGDQWFIVRGGEKSDGELGTMRSVSRRIVESGRFAGELFSAADELISARAAGLVGSGAPAEWRMINMNHHLTRVSVDLGELYGRPASMPRMRRRAVQHSLL